MPESFFYTLQARGFRGGTRQVRQFILSITIEDVTDEYSAGPTEVATTNGDATIPERLLDFFLKQL
jgi:hypothetical protein